MQESTCKHCGATIYIIDNDTTPQGSKSWSTHGTWFEIWCRQSNIRRHEPLPETSLEEKKRLLAAKEIMHRDLMQEIEELHREIAQEELRMSFDDLLSLNDLRRFDS